MMNKTCNQFMYASLDNSMYYADICARCGNFRAEHGQKGKNVIYLKVAWIDGTDADYFCFSTLEQAWKYILNEHIEGYVISDNRIDDLPNDDYTYIESLQ